jgi:hypothetical protein
MTVAVASGVREVPVDLEVAWSGPDVFLLQ